MILAEFLIKIGIAPDICTELVFGSRINYELNPYSQDDQELSPNYLKLDNILLDHTKKMIHIKVEVK